MSNDDYQMVQVKLYNEGWHDVSWIPEKFAVLNKSLEIYNSTNKKWEPWKVVEIWSNPFPYRYIRERGQDYKKTRETSDI